MGRFKVGIQCSSIGHRCGIYTYSQRVEEYLNKNDVDTVMFANKCREDCDIINIQYEPGLIPPTPTNDGRTSLVELIDMFTQPIVVTVHHTGAIPQFYDKVDGLIFHNKNQIIGKPWNSVTIPHAALVYPKQDIKSLRKKYGIPEDKKVLGTAGFIAGTGKHIPEMAEYLLENIKDDEFLYFITSFWKGGDFGYTDMVNDVVSKYNKKDNFKIDTEFVPSNILNEKMQCCDFMFTWNDSVAPGGTSGIAMDMLGAHKRIIVKDAPHYDTAKDIEGVLIGRQDQKEFAEDTLNAFRNEDLTKVPKIDDYSWDNVIKKQIEYFEQWL